MGSSWDAYDKEIEEIEEKRQNNKVVDNEIIPYNKEKLSEIMNNCSCFAQLCFKEDSLHRGLAWAEVWHKIEYLIQEEKLHNFTFPSPRINK